MLRLLQLIHIWLIIVPVMALATVFFGCLAILAVPFAGPRKTATFTAVPWARLGLLVSGISVRIENPEHIRPGQSYVVASNHLSQLDIWVLYGYLGLDLRWVMKQELRKVPIIGTSCAALGHVFIDRSNREAALRSLHQARSNIVAGTSILFFPEGTRSKDGQLKAFKKGAFNMALDLQLPILPVTLNGTWEALPPGSLSLSPGPVTLVIHAPQPVRNLSEADLDSLTEQVHDVIASGLQPLRGTRSVSDHLQP